MNDKGKNRMNQVDNEEKNKINQMSEESLEIVTGGNLSSLEPKPPLPPPSDLPF